ncbi:MAG: MBL fold metallo-hydrolase [Candidatus Thermoplasmatota archaeon]|nr:MBL fold metallo-hydrolase [Candidatus Thermoplasmatota archaeon]
MNLTVYGGVHEIGGNKILLEHNGTRLFLDFGTSMGYESDFFSDFLQPRVNTALYDRITIGALPKINGIYRKNAFIPPGIELLESSNYPRLITQSSPYLHPPVIPYEDYKQDHKQPYVHGILLTHAHLDHTGAIGYLHQSIPLYCSAITEKLVRAIDDVTVFTSEALTIRSKHVTFYKDTAAFPKSPTLRTESFQRPCINMKDMESKNIGDLRITLIEQDHSIPGASSYIVESENKRILYTGDIRFHGAHPLTIKDYSKKVGGHIDVMICEGTRIDSDVIVPEDHVLKKITDDILASKGLVFVDFSWKDTTRYETIRTACQKTNRVFVINARLAYLLYKLDMYPTDDEVKVFLKRKGSCLYSPGDYSTTKHELGFTPKEKHPDNTHYLNGILADDIKKEPDRYVMMLSYFDLNQLFDLSDDSGKIRDSRFIKAQCAPFSDEMELDEDRFIHWLETFGISYALDETPLPDNCFNPYCEKIHLRLQRAHVSGHASQPELKELISRIHPDILIPVHTLRPELFSSIIKEIGEDIKVIEPMKGKRISI